MTGEFSTLHKVKATREETALKVLREKLLALSRALEIRDDRQKIVSDSIATLSEREAALYDSVMHKVVETRDIDAVKERIDLIREAHQQLEDELVIATQQCDTLDDLREQASRAFQAAQRDREKLETVLDQFAHEQARADEHFQEAEIDDLYSSRFGRRLS